MRLIVFDLDGTLVDSGAHIGQTMTAAFAEECLPLPTAEATRDIIGLSLEHALERLSGRTGPTLDRLAAVYRRLYHQSVAHVGTEPLFEGIREVLDGLHAEKGTLLAIATGKGLRGVDRALSLHGLETYFASLQTPDTNPSKPNPAMLAAAMCETGVTPTQTVMIGDTSFDMEMARAAGCFALGVIWGYHRPQILRRAGAHAIVSRAGNLLAAINSLVKPDA
jgi:phosphoglycolate phosphatase